MVEWEVRIFFPDNSFGQFLDDNRFSRVRKKEFFSCFFACPLTVQINRPKEHSSLLF